MNSIISYVKMISFRLIGLTPPLFDLPWYENVSEIFCYLIFFGPLKSSAKIYVTE